MNSVNDEPLKSLLAEVAKLRNRITVLEEETGRNWESLRPAQNGGFDVPSDQEIRTLAFNLKSSRSDVTDVKLLHMFDLLLHLFSMWPVLPQTTRHYAYNMARLANVASIEAWSIGAQQSNGFSPLLTPSLLNGHRTPIVSGSSSMNTRPNHLINSYPTPSETPTATVSAPSETPMGLVTTPKKSSIQQLTAEDFDTLDENLASVASTSSISVPIENQTPGSTATTPKVKNGSPTVSPQKREAVDNAECGSPPKVANMNQGASSSMASTSGPSVLSKPLSYVPKCLCNKPAKRNLTTSNASKNKGRWFYKCHSSVGWNTPSGCGYFAFEDQFPEKQPKSCSICSKTGHNKTNCPARPKT